jgi:hypothetical protein
MKNVLLFMAAILATGAVLNVAGSGRLGTGAQNAAQYVTRGYGV